MAYRTDDYASKGVGTAALTTGIIGTALGSGILNGGLGGLFGGQNPASSATYQLSQKDSEISRLQAEKYSDNKFFQLSERMAGVEARVLTIEKTEPLRDQILGDRIATLQATLSRIAMPMVPNFVLAPGYGAAQVSAVAPIVATPTASTSTTAAAA